jgi:hypothetical protein
MGRNRHEREIFVTHWQSSRVPALTVRSLLFCAAIVTVLAWLTVSLIGAAYATCEILDAGGRASLLGLYFPAILAAAGAAFSFGAWATRRLPGLTRVATGTILAIAACGVAIALSVPIYGEDFWVGPPPASQQDFSGTAECGPGGIPTWWPIWLSH